MPGPGRPAGGLLARARARRARALAGRAITAGSPAAPDFPRAAPRRVPWPATSPPW